jgi:hypothetical protein
MSLPTYFVQECPTCGRNLEIRVEYLGKQVICQHCHGKFVSSDCSEPDRVDLSDSLLLRAEKLLKESAIRRPSAS